MSTLQLARNDVRDLQVGDRRLLFHIPTTAIFEADGLGGEVVDLFRDKEQVAESDVRERFEGRYEPAEVVEVIQELISLRVIQSGPRPAAQPIQITELPLSTMVLNVNTGCNLSCTYCYKEDLQPLAIGQKMDPATAFKAVELLLAEAKTRDTVNIVFFGGEPLTNMAVIRQVVDYAEARGRETGKLIDFSLTTNGVLLKDELIDFFDAHRFGLTISMDGPRTLHDRNRRTVGGGGSYDLVAPNVRRLLPRYRSRPVGARATLTAGVTDVVGIHHHLVDELGFAEAGYSPVTAGPVEAFNLSPEELWTVFQGLQELGRQYRDAALRNQNTGFGNMHQLISNLHEGTSKRLPCGAGLNMLAVDRKGDLNLCHRFTGSQLPTFGNVSSGVAKQELTMFLENAANRSDTDCNTCWIRHLCAGGCYHEAYTRYGDPLQPNYHYCTLMRQWTEFGIQVYAEIMRSNPAFIDRYVAPRRGHS